MGAVYGTIVVLMLAGTAAPAVEDLNDLPETIFFERAREDLASVQRHRRGLQFALEFMNSRPDLFPAKASPSRIPRQDERDEIIQLWKSVLDYTLALDSLGKLHSRAYNLGQVERQRQSFLVAHSAFMAQFAFALRFIERIEKDPSLDTILNEPVEELGLPDGMYRRYKFRFLNVARATEFAAQQALFKMLWLDEIWQMNPDLDEDKEVILEAGGWQGPLMTLQNGWKTVRDAGFTAWFPVQAGVSEWMGDTRVYRGNQFLISQEQIAEIAPKLQPGDVLLERREWYLSNVGLPGFWPHAALYIGSPEEREAFFDDEDVRSWAMREGHQNFEEYLKASFPAAYSLLDVSDELGHGPRVIEAMSEGVLFTTIEHSAAADSLVVLRPRLPKSEKAKAISRAFGFVGRPYDFDFNFLTNQAMVCTEVVYKAYEPGQGMKGISLPLISMMGRPVTPANEIARQFAEQWETESQQFDFILFLDGIEKEKKAVPAGKDEFLRSIERPKWHVLVQDLP